ncbi:MAG: tetratricopeptide repeat protein [Myxococcota bacterium]
MEPSPRRSRAPWIGLGLALLTLLSFAPVCENGFVSYDDDLYVTRNRRVQEGLSLESVRWALEATSFGNWHPLTWISHMLDVELYGLDPATHHATNLGLHVLNVLLLYAFLLRATGRAGAAGVTAALFAVHPQRVEVVAWIAERKELLSTAFGLASLWLYCGYARGGGRGAYAAALVTFALALTAKPMLVTLPFLLLLLDLWPLGRLRRALRHVLLEKLPFAVLSLASVAITFAVREPTGGFGQTLSLAQRAATAVVAAVRYLGMLVWPSDLSVLYAHPYQPGGTPPATWEIAGALLVLLGLSGLFAQRARREPYLLTGWLWYLGTLVPVSGLVQIGRQGMADRYTYVPSIGLLVLLVWGVANRLTRRSSRGVRAVMGLGLAACLGASVLASRAQVEVWRDSRALFEHGLEIEPRNPTLNFNLANRLRLAGELAAATEHYRRAVEEWPGYARAHHGLGLALALAGEHSEAIDSYRRALRIDPHYADAHSSLAVSLEAQGRIEAALRHYRMALANRPDHVEAHYNLGRLLAERGLRPAAIEHYTAVLRVEPTHPEAHYNLGLLRVQEGRIDGAIRHFRSALAGRPAYTAARMNLGVVLASQGKLDEALAQLETILSYDPSSAQAHYNLGLLRAARNEKEAAVEHYRRSLELEPENPDAHNNLGVLLAAQGHLDEAISHYRAALRLQPGDPNLRRNLEAALSASASR